ncbi:MAG: putative Ig domain-containing protein, partial [Rhodocyclaceae bacterium]|nr:putative Ig domain-containing protein [Rhodocyclaceae bacterium]
AIEDAGFSFTVPTDAFVDVDAGDALTLSARLLDGSALPSWLTFEAASRTFSGTPTNSDVGSVDLAVTATDAAGVSVSSTFAVAVANTNDAPEVAYAIADQSATEDAVFSFTVPGGAFADVDAGDSLSYAATLGNGDPLPSWLSFDAANLMFSGTPANGDVGALNLTVIATDIAGASVTNSFSVTVANTNDAPLAIADSASATEDSGLPVAGNVLANDSDPDAGSVMAVADPGVRQGAYGSLTLAGDGSYSYALDNAASAVQALGAGQSAVDRFVYRAGDGTAAAVGELAVTIAGANDIPVLAVPLQDRQLDAKAVFSWQLPTGSFVDADSGDALGYSAALADGSALPAWLAFDAATQTFSGQVPNNAKGSLDIRVTASDGHGSQSAASDVFRVTLGKGQGDCGGHGRDDDRPPGHDDNHHDSHGSGHHGSNGGGRDDDDHGRDGKLRHRDHKDDGDDWDAQRDRKPACLDAKQLDRHYADFAGERREADTSAYVRRWIEVDLAVSRWTAAQDKSLPALADKHGADITALHGAANGFLGSKTASGVDHLSLAVGAGTQMKGFGGLQEGLRRIG